MTKKKINTAIIGFGISGKFFHAPFIHTNRGFRLKIVVERHSKKSNKLYPNVEVIRDYHDLFDDSTIDLVVVTTPNVFHFQMVKDILEAGKHVVIEKPFTTNTEEADKLIKLAKSLNLNLFVYHNRRWDGDFITIKNVLKSRVLGPIESYEAHFDRYRPHLKKDAWRDVDQPGGGIVYDLGSHLIDQTLQLFGKPESLLADIQKQRKGSVVDDYFDIQMNYPDKVAVLKAGMLVRDQGPRFIIHGKKGSYLKYGIDPQEEALRKGLMPVSNNWGVESPEYWGLITVDNDGLDIDGVIETESGCYQEFYRNVYSVIVNGNEMAVHPKEARNVIRIIELAIKSNAKKMLIKIGKDDLI